MISFATNPTSQADDLRALFLQALDDLDASRTSIDENHVRYTVQAHLCSHLTSLAVRLKSQMVTADVHRSVTLLFNILHQRDTLLYEEALFTLSRLYSNVGQVFTWDHVQTMLDIIRFSLASESPGVINAASILLADIFRFSGRELQTVFPIFFEIEEKLLRDNGEWRDIHPFLIRAIAEMYCGVGQYPEHHEMINEWKERLFELMRMVRTVRIDLSKEADLQYAGHLFENLAVLYRVYAELFYPKIDSVNPTSAEIAAEKAVLLEMNSFAQVLLRIQVVNEFVLQEYILMVKAFAVNCSRRNNVILNKKPVLQVLDMTMERHRNHRLISAGKEAKLYLNSR
jgi:hypothetical protein